eukprot:gene2402-3195_t
MGAPALKAAWPPEEAAENPSFVMEPSHETADSSSPYDPFCGCVLDQCRTGVCDGNDCVFRADGTACTTDANSPGACKDGTCAAADFSETQCIAPGGPGLTSHKQTVRSRLSVLEDSESDAAISPDLEEDKTRPTFAGYFVGAGGLLFILAFFAFHLKLVWDIRKSMVRFDPKVKGVASSDGDKVGEDEGAVTKEPTIGSLKEPLGVINLNDLPIKPYWWHKFFFSTVMWMKPLPTKWTPSQAEYVLDNDHAVPSLHGIFFDNLLARAYWWTLLFNLYLGSILTIPFIVPFCVPGIVTLGVVSLAFLALLLMLRLMIMKFEFEADAADVAMKVVYWTITVISTLPLIFGLMDVVIGAKLAAHVLRKNARAKKQQIEMAALEDEEEDNDDEEEESDDDEDGKGSTSGVDADYSQQ